MKTNKEEKGRERRKWSVPQKKAMVRRFERSRQNGREFCQREGIHYSLLARWRQRWGSGSIRIEPLRVVGLEEKEEQGPVRMEVTTPRGVVIRVRRGCEGKLFKEVWACCCV